LQEKSDGRFALQIFPSSTFASYRDAITAVQLGTLDMAPLDTAIDCLPASGVMLSPYTFRDYDHWRAFKTSDVYTSLLRDISEACDVEQLILYTLATFAGFPAARRPSYLALRSGLNCMATSAGMYRASRRGLRPPPMNDFPCH
jgi:TRAP-type C4-dicarboxylate transport system substrate-binding protein